MKIKGKVVALVLSGAVCLVPCHVGKAAELQTAQEELIHLDNLYSNSISTTLVINNGSAQIRGRVSGIAGTTTKIKAKVTLQKYSGGQWTAVKTYEKTVTTTNCIVSETKAVSSGKYRVKGVYTVYKGAKSEKTTQYSSTVTC